MMKRKISNGGKRHAGWSRHRGWIQGDAGYSLVPDLESQGNGDSMALSSYKEEPCLEKQLQPGDTLQSLALEFNCSTAELKRVNRILKDNEIFALRVVKIPARCYSLLTERLPSVHTAACTAESSRGAPHATPIGPHAPVIQPRDFQAAGDAASVTGLLDVDGEDGAPSPYEADTKEFAAPYNGADWGLSWLTLLMAALILGFVGPIVLYITLIVHKKT